MPFSPAERLFGRLVIGFLAAAILGYFALVVAPFFLHGLHQQPANLVTGGYFDPKGLAPFGGVGSSRLTYILAALSMVWSPIASVVLLVMGPLLLWRYRRDLSGVERRAIQAFVLLSAAYLCLLITPTGRLIGTWFVD